MEPKRAADVQDGTAVRKKRKTFNLKLTSTGPTTHKTANESGSSDDDSTMLPKKRRRSRDEDAAEQIPMKKKAVARKKRKTSSRGDSKALQLPTGKDTAAGGHTPTTITPITACDAVLNTTELLDAILSILPVGIILRRYQTVCKNWKSAIETSPTIQTKLWFKSEASDPVPPDSLSADHAFLTSPRTGKSKYYRRRMEQNLPCYNGGVASNPLFLGYRHERFRSNLMPSSGMMKAPVAGSPTYHQFCIDEVEKLIGKQYSWLDMYLTEPRITTARLTMDLPMRGGIAAFLSYNIANELVHDQRGLSFRTIVRRVKEVCESGHWRATGSSFRRPGLARVTVHLFSGV